MASLEEIVSLLKGQSLQMSNMSKSLESRIEDVNKALGHEISTVRSDLEGQLKMQTKAMYETLERKVEAQIQEVFEKHSSSPTNGYGDSSRVRNERGKGPITDYGLDHSRTSPRAEFEGVSRIHLGPGNRQRRRETIGGINLNLDEDTDGEEFAHVPPRNDRPNRGRELLRDGRDDHELHGIKFNVPAFRGTNDPNEYIEWKSRMEFIFACHRYSEFKKLQVAIVEFKDYAITWWEKMQNDLNRLGGEPITTWRGLLRAMENRFVPAHFKRDLHQKLEFLSQGSRTVDEYFKEMETLMIRAKVEEDEENTMARFMRGLRKDIMEVVDLHPYANMVQLLQLATKVESHQKRRYAGSAKANSSVAKQSWSNKPWQKSDHRVTKPKPFEMPKDDRKVEKPRAFDKGKNVTCFKCQRKGHYANECPNEKKVLDKRSGLVRRIVVKQDGELKFLSDGEEEEDDIVGNESDIEYEVDDPTLEEDKI